MKIVRKNNKYYYIKQNNKYYGLGGTEQTMYATIKGSLTKNDGVFSGFSSSNYLITQNSISSDDYNVIEFNTEITTGSSIADGQILGIAGYYVLGLAIINSKFYCRTNFGSYSNAISDITPQANTAYTIKGIIDKRNSTISINVNGTINSDTFTYETARSGQYRIGYNTSIGTLNGSINLDKTSIKINSTKYNLQAVAGYTIVGSSPTIVDGIASNFSSSKYLTINNNIVTMRNNYEVCFKFMLTSAVNYAVLFNFKDNNENIRIGAQFNSAGSIWCCFRYNGTSNQLSIDTPDGKVALNQWYYLKYKYSNSTIEIFLSSDGTTWELLGSKIATINLTIPINTIGNRDVSTERYFRGSINLFESYIIIDDKLWFNGHQG